MSKFIFLDIDGILNSVTFEKYCVDNKFKDWWINGILDQHCMILLKRLVKITGAKIVLCSSWRTSYEHMARLSQQFDLYGLSIYGTTNENSTMGRGQQIMEWVYNHENCDNFVVLDDDNTIHDYPPETEVTSHLVVPSYEVGLTENDVEMALKILGR